MDWTTAVPAIIAVLAALSGMYLGWTARAKEVAKEYRDEGKAVMQLQADTSYIRRGVDNLQIEVRDQGRRFDELTERVAKVEESSKQAHKRINRLDNIIDKAGSGDSD